MGFGLMIDSRWWQNSFHDMYGYRFRVTIFIRVQLKERKVVR